MMGLGEHKGPENKNYYIVKYGETLRMLQLNKGN